MLVMISLLVAATILATLVQSSIRQHRQADRELLRAQAEWCADAGLQRALSQCQTDPDYLGETLTLKPVLEASLPQLNETSSQPEAGVEITVTTEGTQRRIQVIAQYPQGDLQRVEASLSLTLPKANTPSPSSALKPENLQP